MVHGGKIYAYANAHRSARYSDLTLTFLISHVWKRGERHQERGQV